MKITSHTFRSLAALMLFTLIPESVAKLGESHKNVDPEEHDDKLDRHLKITTSNNHHKDDDAFTFSLEMETTDNSEHFNRMLLKMMQIEWEDNWFDTFGEEVVFAFDFEDSSDRNLIVKEDMKSKRELQLQRTSTYRNRVRSVRIRGRIRNVHCGNDSRVPCKYQRPFDTRRGLEEDDLSTIMQNFGDDMSNLFVSIGTVKVTL